MPPFLLSLIRNPWSFVLLMLIVAAYFLWRTRSKEFKDLGGGTTLRAYTRDMTADAKAGKIQTVIGRAEEIDRTIHILSRKTKNNPILLGPPGVGKTAIVEGLVLRMVQGEIPDNLKGKRVLALDLGGMISGTKYRGEFEERVKKLLAEMLAEERRIILFIDEVHMIVQAKGSEGALNVSDILKPALARGDLQAIGATTSKEYDEYIRPDDALNRRFQPVMVGEPKSGDALLMLRGIAPLYGKHHGVSFSDEALRAAVEYSSKYIHERFLPDKAIDLIDEAGAKVGIESSHAARHAAGLLHAAGGDKRRIMEEAKKRADQLKEEVAHLKKLEAEMADEEELDDLRKKMEHLMNEFSDVSKMTETDNPEVTRNDIRQVVAEWTGKKISKIV